MAQFENGAYYECEVVDSGITESTNGNPMIVLNVRPIYKIRNRGLEDQKLVAAESDSERVIRLVFSTEAQREMNLKKLREAGWDGMDFSGFDMRGMVVVCSNKHSENNGKTYDGFDLPLPGFTADSVDKSKQGELGKKMNALLAGTLKSIQPAEKRKRSSAPPAEQKQSSDSSDSADSDSGLIDDETPF